MRTPLAGVVTAIVVLLAIYALPPRMSHALVLKRGKITDLSYGLLTVFFYIPNACLAAVIIHAVCDLITPPRALYDWWLVNPPEVVIFFAGVIGTIFGTIEIGI